MAATGTPTPNIGLRIPQGTDPASVDDINYNSNLLDTKLGAVGNTSVQDQIDSLNSKLSVSTPSITKGSTITSGSSVNARQCANVVTIASDVTTNTTLTGYVTIATCEKHPHTNEYITWVDTQGNTKMGRLSSGGELQIYNPANNTNYMATITFVATN